MAAARNDLALQRVIAKQTTGGFGVLPMHFGLTSVLPITRKAVPAAHATVNLVDLAQLAYKLCFTSMLQNRGWQFSFPYSASLLIVPLAGAVQFKLHSIIEVDLLFGRVLTKFRRFRTEKTVNDHTFVFLTPAEAAYERMRGGARARVRGELHDGIRAFTKEVLERMNSTNGMGSGVSLYASTSMHIAPKAQRLQPEPYKNIWEVFYAGTDVSWNNLHTLASRDFPAMSSFMIETPDVTAHASYIFQDLTVSFTRQLSKTVTLEVAKTFLLPFIEDTTSVEIRTSKVKQEDLRDFTAPRQRTAATLRECAVLIASDKRLNDSNAIVNVSLQFNFSAIRTLGAEGLFRESPLLKIMAFQCGVTNINEMVASIEG